MDDLMNNINQNVQQSQPAERAVGAAYTEPKKADSNVFTAADVYEMGKLSYNNEGSVVAEMALAILGAVVGALPGMLLWILIGRAGIVAALCGTLLAAGTAAGYTFMSKDKSVAQKYGFLVCIIVIIIAVFISEKIVWCWIMSDEFHRTFSAARESAYSFGEAGGMTRAEVDSIVNESMMEEFGFTEGTFSDFFYHFGKTLRALGLSGKYFFNLLTCYLFAGAGGFSAFKKMSK